MLVKHIPATDGWDEANEVFVHTPAVKLVMEHSLISLSKWESKWKKPFLTKDTKTEEELRDYIRCMVISPTDVDPITFSVMPTIIVNDIFKYVNDSQTATTVKHRNKGRRSAEIPTSELIYYWMVENGIPFSCEKWHLSRLLTLIDVCNVKGQKPEKMSKKDIYRQNEAINAANRARFRTKG